MAQEPPPTLLIFTSAIGPFATIYDIWSTGAIPDKAPVPTWILAFGGALLVIGLWTYGYNIMRSLGNKLTLNSPSRGFSMELGSAITVIVATRLSESYWIPCHTGTEMLISRVLRASSVYYPVYHWCYCWSRSLQRYLARPELAHDCLDLCRLDHHVACRRNYQRCLNGNHSERAPLVDNNCAIHCLNYC